MPALLPNRSYRLPCTACTAGDVDDLMPMMEMDDKKAQDEEDKEGTLGSKAGSSGSSEAPKLKRVWQEVTPGQAKARIAKQGRCSALVKVG